MTARPQQMPDGQDKSDDLIAELAKLMASGAGGAEPDAKPAPRLVTLDEGTAPPAGIRIPGMDAPVAPAAQQPAAARPMTPPPALRIPGMDRPVPASPAPAMPSAAASVAPPAEAAPAKPAAFDFGVLPAASAMKPEPLVNWQDREVPRPAARPAAIESVSAPPAPSFAPPAATVTQAAPQPAPVSEPRYEPEAPEPVRVAPVIASAPPVAAEPVVASPKKQPEGDAFNFDFGFGSAPPVEQHAAEHSDDPIADLISADLDAGFDEPVAPAQQQVALRPSIPPQPAPRPLPQPAAQRPLGQAPVPARPMPAPPPRLPERAPMQQAVATAPHTPVERDPMEEIESLIGEAVRVELSSPERAAPQMPAPVAASAAPVVPPLTTGFAPRRASLKDAEPRNSSSESAILAAAAASGSDTLRSDSRIAAEPSPYKRPRAKAEKRSFMAGGMRQYVGMAVAGTLLLAAGFGLYWVIGMGRGNDGEAPVLKADATPVKETPPATATTDTQGSVVFNEMDGVKADPNEQLVSRDSTTDTPVADVARTVGTDGDTSSESELANRKVRTVTVRPDGTIVNGDEAVAGNEELPVDRPNVPDLPGGDVQPSELLASVPTNDTPAAATQATTDASANGLSASYTPNPNAVINPNIVAPVPMARPADRSTLGGGSNAKVAAVATPAAPVDLMPATDAAPAAAAPVSSGGGSYVQLSSQPTEADAQASLRATQKRLGNVVNDAGLEIRQVNLGAKGTWYRVVLPTASFQTATQTCASMKAQGVDCVAIKG
ncbi:SPOR domain-containing protein [Devosia sp.]|uniref:SPOR domain-containing protein n=1 Tax=Devosia sp. TaxID=1871048 RepID=UPI003BAC7916